MGWPSRARRPKPPLIGLGGIKSSRSWCSTLLRGLKPKTMHDRLSARWHLTWPFYTRVHAVVSHVGPEYTDEAAAIVEGILAMVRAKGILVKN